jgi:CHAP domain
MTRIPAHGKEHNPLPPGGRPLPTRGFKPVLAVVILGSVIMASVLAACAPSSTASEAVSASASVTPAPTEGATSNRYVDAKLGFSLVLPSPVWSASLEPGLHQEPGISAVSLTSNENSTHQLIVIGVFESSGMPKAFAERGQPTTHIGPYPAFLDDRLHNLARMPCLVRIFLARDDYVMATWCSADAEAHTSEFEELLATFLPAAPGFVPHAAPAPAPESCSQVETGLGYTASATRWGTELATPTELSPAGGWRQLEPGISICSNTGSTDLYLFQCTELVNRFLYEEWALPHIPGNAARYFDYYQNGRLHPGVIRDLPAGTYQLSSDASQGNSAFPPQAGDLLIFQDVNNPPAGWTSGLADSPGHIAIVTGTDATHVYVAQENYNDTQYFLALPLSRVANGWHITDLSGISNRIVRGWILLSP